MARKTSNRHKPDRAEATDSPATPVHTLPATGGRYRRDAVSGALIRLAVATEATTAVDNTMNMEEPVS